MNPLYLFGKEITPIRKLLLMKLSGGGGSAVELTATGNPVSFTALARAFRKLSASFLPTQSGSGDPSPSNVRPILGTDAVNVWQYPENQLSINRNSSQTSNGITFTPVKDVNNKTIAVHVKGTATQTNTFFTLNYVNGTTLSVPSGSYKCYGGNSRISIQGFIINANGNEQNVFDNKTNDVSEFTIPSDAKASWVRLRVNVQTPVDETIYPIIVNADETITAYPVQFPVLGKNLFSTTLEQGTIRGTDGVPVSNNTRVRSKDYIKLTEGTYTLSAIGAGGVMFYLYDTDGTYIQSIGWKNSIPFTISFNQTYLVRIALRKSANDEEIVPSDVSNVQLESGSSATPYEPYTRTVYGGSLDLVSGVLTATYAYVDLGSKNYTKRSENQNRQIWESVFKDAEFLPYQTTAYQADALCSEFSITTSNGAWTVGKFSPATTAGNNVFIFVFPANSFSTADECKEAMQGIQLVYKLATPKTFQLTPQQITALKGENVIWSDANGDVEVTYLAKG